MGGKEVQIYIKPAVSLRTESKGKPLILFLIQLVLTLN